jgi:predicted nucleic acid-binding Zn finger protein
VIGSITSNTVVLHSFVGGFCVNYWLISGLSHLIFYLATNASRIGPTSVKVHAFTPSGKKIYTVVGKADEYWTAPDLDFCSCKSFYYRSLASGKPCTHLTSARKAIREESFSLTEFIDYEYVGFLQAIINDSSKNVLAP